MEQVSIALALNQLENRLENANRLSMIVLDNSIECCFRSFILSEKRLVGKGKQIRPSRWANDSESFTLVMNHAYKNCGSQSLPDRSEVAHFHDTRNKLYHKEKSLNVSSITIKKYFQFAKVFLNEFFGFSATDESWDRHIEGIRNAFLVKPRQIVLPITYQKEHSDIRAYGIQSLKQKEAIAIVVHCFSTAFAREPTTDELVASMAASGASIDKNTLGVQLFNLRKEKAIKQRKLSITSTHRRKLAKQFDFRMIDSGSD